MTMQLTCAECRFQMYGECRRHAPRAWPETIYHHERSNSYDLKARWPSVEIYSDGCGEYEAAPPAEAPPAATMTEPCATCGSTDGGKTYFKPGMQGDCPTCGATDEIPF